MERPWLVRAGHLTVSVRHLDDRGFDRVALETRVAQPDGSWKTLEATTLLEQERGWYRDRGELELYQRDIDAALRAVRDQRLRDGWESLAPLSLQWGSTEAPTTKLPRSSAGVLEIGGLALRVQVSRHTEGCTVELIRPSNGRRLPLVEVSRVPVELSKDRAVRRSVGRVAEAWLTPDNHWVVFAVDLAPALHAEVRPGRALTTVSVEDMVRELELPRDFLSVGSM